MKNITQKIPLRDKFRTGKNYYNSLRGYQVREDVLNSMFKSIDTALIPKDKKIMILDAGCGPGIVGDYVYKKMNKKNKLSPSIIFVDISESMLEAVPKNKDYHAVKGDVTNLPFPDNFFNIVLMKQVLDYLPKTLQLRTINELYRVLKPNGQLILSALISPDNNSNILTNKLYDEREKIIARQIAVKKYIPTKDILIDWLAHNDFKNVKISYIYDIPLSPLDFQKSFGLDEKQTSKLNNLYKSLIKEDKNNSFRKKKVRSYFELVEKGIILRAYKK
jgi:ubiquinone/menaquinone biosynthesis C-methylase UbiE